MLLQNRVLEIVNAKEWQARDRKQMATLVVLDGVCSGRTACRYPGLGRFTYPIWPITVPATGAAGHAHA